MAGTDQLVSLKQERGVGSDPPKGADRAWRAWRSWCGRCADLLANRVLAQLAAVSRTRLADLPPQRSFRLDAFVAAQAALTASQASVLGHPARPSPDSTMS